MAGAGYSNITGSSNVFLGYNAGYNETGSNKLYIANTNTNTPLIYGDFSAGTLGIGTSVPGSALSVNGGISAGTYYNIAAPSGGLIISGNVGIGATSPGAKLDVQNNTTGTAWFTNTGTSGASAGAGS